MSLRLITEKAVGSSFNMLTAIIYSWEVVASEER